MTYIKRERRAAIDPIVDGLVKRLRSIDAGRHDVAYAVTRVAMETMRPQVRWSRKALIDCVAALYEAAEEIETRMVNPYTNAEIELNGDLECFQDEEAPLVPLPPGEKWTGEKDTFNVLGTTSGRTQCGHENPCAKETKSDVNPCVEVSNSLAPGMNLSDLHLREGEIKSILETLTNDQIEAAEKQRRPLRQIGVQIKVNEDRKGVTLTRVATGHHILVPNDTGLGGKLDVARALLLGNQFVNVWGLSISLEKWGQVCSRVSQNSEEERDGVSDTE